MADVELETPQVRRNFEFLRLKSSESILSLLKSDTARETEFGILTICYCKFMVFMGAWQPEGQMHVQIF